MIIDVTISFNHSVMLCNNYHPTKKKNLPMSDLLLLDFFYTFVQVPSRFCIETKKIYFCDLLST